LFAFLSALRAASSMFRRSLAAASFDFRCALLSDLSAMIAFRSAA
jgi:hypothetical protein